MTQDKTYDITAYFDARVRVETCAANLKRWEAGDTRVDYYADCVPMASDYATIHAFKRAVKMATPSYTPQSLFTRDLLANVPAQR